MRTGTRKALALGAVALLGLGAQTALAVSTCSDSVLPTFGNDTNPGFVPAGPSLVSPGGQTGYNYAVSTSDDLQFHVVSAPGVGSTTLFTRKLWIALTGTGVTDYPDALANACQMSWLTFGVASPASGVTVTAGASDTCSFDHMYAVAWNTFRDGLANCGFTKSTNDSNPANGTYTKFVGRVHVKWEDYDVTAQGALGVAVRPAASTWYPVTIQVQDTANFTSNPVTNTETPYNANFKVDSITYSKDTDGVVTANFAYSLTTKYPYYAKVNGSTASNYLIHSGTTYAGLTLAGSWAYSAVMDGTEKTAGTPCAVGDDCTLSGTLSYTWTPTTGSCQLSSTTAQQFDFTLECAANTIGNDCGKPMRDALALPAFGSFKLDGNLDFCKVATTDFPISWPAPFDVVGGATRQIGAQITTTGQLSSNKKIYGISLLKYRATRNDLTTPVTWELYNAGATTPGTNTGFAWAAPLDAGTGLAWTVSASYTPNIKLNSAAGGERTNHLIVLPDDKGKDLSFTMIVDFRMYTDSASLPARKRRLLYRDVPVQTAPAAAVKDGSATTSAVKVAVPANIQVSTDGKVTVVNSQQLSTGAIAGIAVAGAVVGIAGVALAVFAIRRHKRNAAAQGPADFEKAPMSKSQIVA